MGFFASLFGQNPQPRQESATPRAGSPSVLPATAPAGPLPGQEGVTIQPQSSVETADVPSLLTAARGHLDRQDLPAALQIYEQIAEMPGDLGAAFTTISGDLGATGNIDAMVEFFAPRYDPSLHGLPPGINLLQAYLHRRDVFAAQQLLDLLSPLVTTYSMRDRLDGFRSALAQLRSADAPEAAPTTAPDVALINISKPIWTYGLADGENTLPTKNHRARRLAILPLALVGPGIPAGQIAPSDHPLASLVRGLVFALAEACWFAPAYRPVAMTGIDPAKNLLLAPRAFSGEQIRQLFPKEKEPVDYAIAGTVQADAQNELAAVEFTIWDVRKNKGLKTLRFEGADAVNQAWPLLLGYIEAAKPGPAPISYTLPADPARHAVALDHVLHFFLAEKGVLAAEKLAPHEARLAAVAAYAESQGDAVVARFAVIAAAHHCRNLGLSLSPELEARVQRLSGT